MNKEVDDLLTGPNTVKTHYRRDGKKFYSRSGTRAENNRIEFKFHDTKKQHDAITLMLHLRLSDEEGNRLYEDMALKEFADVVDLAKAEEMALLIKSNKERMKEDDELSDSDEDDSGNESLDDKTERNLKN